MSLPFYSQVNNALQRELIARGSAGTANRTTAAINYMVGKVANVELLAYGEKPNVNSKPLPGFGVLGGQTVLKDSYMPTGPVGFLNDAVRPSYRIPPVLTAVSFNFNDTSKNYINKANITIQVPDATTDLDEIEEIYCSPGRYIRIKIMHDESVVLTGEKLENQGLPTTGTIQSFFPNVNLEDLRKMNEAFFTGRIVSFTYSYSADGSVEVSVEATGVSNIYADVSTIINNKPKTSGAGTKITNEVSNIYTDISSVVDARIQEQKKINPDIVDFEYAVANLTDRAILVGTPYTLENTQTTPSTERMVTLGFLIDFLNENLLANISAPLICTDTACQSNFYERLVSANPMEILLWSGTSDIPTDVYTYNILPAPSGIRKADLKMFPKVERVTPGFAVRTTESERAFPSRIYINLKTIERILSAIQKTPENGIVNPTVKNFLNKLSEVIHYNTGGAINLVLVQDPLIPDALLYYDANFVNGDISVTEFTLPAFASKTGTSVIRELSLTSQVPESVTSMVFAVSSGDASVQKQAIYNPYLYADTKTKEKLAADWNARYEDVIINLAETINTFGLRPNDTNNIEKLQNVLQRYMIYFTPDIKQSINRNKSVFPMELEFTLDGINGFKYGDVLAVAGLPRRYREAFVFTIIGVDHSVSNDGEWTTKIKCNARARIK
jgi:hypothetical protein